MINWKVRFRNPQFIAQLVKSISTPIFAIMDPITKGIEDSSQALTYNKPRCDQQ